MNQATFDFILECLVIGACIFFIYRAVSSYMIEHLWRDARLWAMYALMCSQFLLLYNHAITPHTTINGKYTWVAVWSLIALIYSIDAIWRHFSSSMYRESSLLRNNIPIAHYAYGSTLLALLSWIYLYITVTDVNLLP